MKKLFFLAGLFVPAFSLLAQPKLQTVTVTFDQPPTAASSVLAAAKYNKDAVFQLEFDDRVGAFRDVFAYWNGGKASDSMVYPGKTFTDGCGHPVNFRAAISCNGYSNGGYTDWEYNGNYITWGEIRNYLSKDWLPMNHGLRHNITDTDWPGYANNIAFMHQYIHDSTGGFSCRVWVSPNADEGYLPSVESFGYLASTSQSARDGFPAYPPADWYKYTTIEALPDSFTQFTRNYNWDWTPTSVNTNLNPLVDALVTGNTVASHKVMRLFSHGEVWSLEGFKAFADYLQQTAGDRVWICGFQEFMEYQELKRRAVKSEVLNGKTLQITMDLSQVPDSAHFRDLSLLVSATGANITGVSVQGADRFTFNPASGLINLFTRRKYGSDTTVANQPPRADAGPDTTLTLPLDSLTLQGRATDPDGFIASYAWSQVSGPGVAVFSSTGIPGPLVSGLVPGSYSFRLTVKDNAGAIASDEVVVTVKAAMVSDSLSITAPPDIQVFNDTLLCSASGISLGTPVVYTTAGIQSLSNNAPALFPVGTTLVTWTVTDIHGNRRQATQNITVTDHERPVITCPVTTAVCYNPAGSYNLPPASARDNCGVQGMSFSISGATTRKGTGANASGPFNPGSSTISWVVTDVNGNSNTCQSTLVVGSPLTVMVPDAFALNKGSDSNTVYLGYSQASSLKLTARPSGGSGSYTYVWNTGALTASINAAPVVYTAYTVTVRDGSGCQASTSKGIKVVNVSCGPKNDMVTICYKGKTSCVKSNTVNAQLNGGAVLGSCPATAPTSMATGRMAGEASLREASAGSLFLECLPNPGKDHFTVRVSGLDGLSAGQLYVYNSIGVLVDQKNLPGDQWITLGQHYPAGIYHVALVQGKRSLVKTVVMGGR